jgi:molecular chaperone GrpE
MKNEETHTDEHKEKPSAPDSNPSANAETADGPEQKIAELEAKHKETEDKYTRLYAEFDNFRRRTAKEKIDWFKTAGEDTILTVLPIMDDMERAIAHNKEVEDIKALKEGLEVIYQKFKSILTTKGIEPMETVGKQFDPDLHDAITSIAAPSDDLKGKVVEEVQKGYMLNGKVMRHAKVIVGN